MDFDDFIDNCQERNIITSSEIREMIRQSEYDDIYLIFEKCNDIVKAFKNDK